MVVKISMCLSHDIICIHLYHGTKSNSVTFLLADLILNLLHAF